jgi:hypothetical protein
MREEEVKGLKPGSKVRIIDDRHENGTQFHWLPLGSEAEVISIHTKNEPNATVIGKHEEGYLLEQVVEARHIESIEEIWNIPECPFCGNLLTKVTIKAEITRDYPDESSDGTIDSITSVIFFECGSGGCSCRFPLDHDKGEPDYHSDVEPESVIIDELGIFNY